MREIGKEISPKLDRKIEESGLSSELKERAEKVASKNGVLDREIFEKIIDVVKSGHNLRFLERMVELSWNGQDVKDLIDDWASYFPLYSLREKTDIKKWRKRLSDPTEVRKSKETMEEIRKELGNIGINLKNAWDFGFEVRQKRRKEKILLEKENIREIFEKYNLPKAVEGEELIEFLRLPPDLKSDILSDDFIKKTKALEIKCESLSQLIGTYKKPEIRKFRKQTKEDKI